ncbi:hypothetical protein [Actinomadura madurae]|uniref:hypothetical protein n=1 Tax=Actinomadura madurae TaxID=1993 RepID=UPI0020D2324C|nr:hypothetical protein [Actinomadura madurae]MCP9947255.1 hypothetical protein [Actinomadura madurae]MCP9976492.1 hypothetical protein [Actinomadura madurae]MCQ0012014.1 hypothetical protein [Actinomadura madurae]
MNTPTPVPARGDLGPDEILVQVYEGEPDGQNRVRFFGYWHDDKTPAEGGPPGGVRGQAYHADLAEFTAERERRGLTVTRWPER